MSFLTDPNNDLVIGSSLVPKSVTTSGDALGAAVDVRNVLGACNAILSIGAAGGGSPTLAGKMQSNTTSDTTGFADITGATFTQVTTTGQSFTLRFSLPAGQSYVRFTGTTGGSSPVILASCVILGQKKYAGTTNSGYSRSPSQ